MIVTKIVSNCSRPLALTGPARGLTFADFLSLYACPYMCASVFAWYRAHRADIHYLAVFALIVAVCACCVLIGALFIAGVVFISSDRRWGLWLMVPAFIVMGVVLVVVVGGFALAVACKVLLLCLVDVAPACARLCHPINLDGSHQAWTDV